MVKDKQRVCGYIADDLYQKLVAEADKEGRSISNMVAILLHKALEELVSVRT